MRSAWICVFLALLVRKGGSITVATTEEFKPTPIPLDNWQKREEQGGAGEELASAALVPAHYWEDALRHSVYLTLVRDKIDQLIAKGDVISPDNRPEPYVSKEVDDHDLWERIKTAPFDRIPADEPPTYGDVSILAKGRLMDQEHGFRFAEDERSREKCYNDTCMEGVKALWSVKRVKQWEPNSPPSKYHYELTFSVISQPPQKQKKPYENPIRTFTVRENTPETVVDRPKEHHQASPTPSAVQRPERAIWYHKNVVPTQRPYLLDRIFSSFLFDDDDEDEPPRKLRAHHLPPHPYPQHAKIGYVGSPSEPQMHKRPGPYKITYKYHVKPPLIGPPIVPQYHQYPDSPINNPYPAQSAEHISKYALVKPFKMSPPTFASPEPIAAPQNTTNDSSTNSNELNTTEGYTKAPEIITVPTRTYPGYSRPIPSIPYPEHIRPPVYNAPPGVFVTMDKKPFKPLPPLKIIHSNKPYYHKITSRPPYDFRPSPQVLDVQFSEPDPLSETAFRPITMNYDHTINRTTERIVASTTTEPNDDYKRKTNRKPPKKHENIKAHRVTTSAPEIITAHNNVDEVEDVEWTKLLSELTQNGPVTTTETDKDNDIEISTTSTSSTTEATVATTTMKKRTTTTAVPEKTTTRRPKRTRPPPDFYLKAEYKDKKKHKRRTTTKAPTTKKYDDLVPQASSVSASSSTKVQKDSTKKPAPTTTSSTTSTTTTTTTTTTQRPTTPMTTTQRPITTVITTTKPYFSTTITARPTTTQSPTTTEAKTTTSFKPNNNRFRQSTLLQKGTSVNHDKWSVISAPGTEKNKSTNSTYAPRRKGSNFHGYVSSTPKHTDEDDDHVSSPYKSRMTSTSTSTSTSSTSSTTEATTVTEETNYDEHELDNETAASNYNEEIEYQDDNFETEQEQQGASSDHNEFIFNVTSTSTSTDEKPKETKPEEIHLVETTTITVPKNKTKCNKKKKYQNLTTTEKSEIAEYVEDDNEEVEPSTTTVTTTTTETEEDIFSLFGYSLDDVTSTTKKHTTEQNTEATETQKNTVRPEDDFEDFFDTLDVKPRKEKAEYNDHHEKEYRKEVEEEDEEDSPFDNEDVGDFSRNSEEDLDEYQVRPLSFLELMGMD